MFIQENAFENVIWEIGAILSLSQCVKQIILEGGREVRNPLVSILLVG